MKPRIPAIIGEMDRLIDIVELNADFAARANAEPFRGFPAGTVTAFFSSNGLKENGKYHFKCAFRECGKGFYVSDGQQEAEFVQTNEVISFRPIENLAEANPLVMQCAYGEAMALMQNYAGRFNATPLWGYAPRTIRMLMRGESLGETVEDPYRVEVRPWWLPPGQTHISVRHEKPNGDVTIAAYPVDKLPVADFAMFENAAAFI